MSQAVLISIQPKWVELIASGKKTIEVRKTRPKIETPFKCYLYETQGKTDTPWMDEDGHMSFRGRGAVIGEFVCEKITRWDYIPDYTEEANPGDMFYPVLTAEVEKTGLEYDEFEEYGKGAPLYGWHISDLVLYDEPKKIYAFTRPPCERVSDCGAGCPYWTSSVMRCMRNYTVFSAPQSWCYVEEQQ